MAEEVIHVTVIDPSVDDALFKLDRARAISREMRQYTLFGQPLSSGRLLDILPSVTRAQRLIITQIPGMREVLQLIFRTRTVLGAGGAVATGVLLVYMANLIKQLDRIQRQMIRDMASFENEVREGLDLTHAEFDELGREIIGFATPWEQLQTELREAKVEGYLEGRWLSWDAIVDYVKTRIGPLEPTAGFQPAANVPPQGTPYAPWLQAIIDWVTQITDEIKEKVGGADSGHVYDTIKEEGLVE